MGMALLAGLGSVATGCYLDLDDDDDFFNGFGEVTITYTFDGLTCDLTEVARIRITVEGQNRGDAYYDTLPCGRFRDGVTVFDLRSDEYAVSVEGLASDDRILYSMERPVLVPITSDFPGAVTVNLSSSSGILALIWTFPDGASCDDVSAMQLNLRDPSGVLYDSSRYDCTLGGVEYVGLQPGIWRVEILALDAAEAVVFRLNERDVEVVEQSFSEYTLLLGD